VYVTKVSMMSYSIDMMKKSAFQDELTNILDIVPAEYRDDEWIIVHNYLCQRIKEIERTYK
jgi:hypothetical protein